MIWRAPFLCCLLLSLLTGCGWVEQNAPLEKVENLAALTETTPAWQSPLLQQHHLVGRIWRSADGRFVDQKVLAEDLVRAAYILLGEKHDNPDHHLLQARLIELLIALGRRPAVIWEMIPETKQPILDSYFTQHSRDGKALGESLGWNLSGWPAWHMYQPVAKAAMAAHLPMYAAGLPKSAIRALARRKPSFKFAKRQRALGLHIALPAGMRERSLEQLFQGHCEMMPRNSLTPMFNVQRVKDAVFAEHMLTSGQSDGALLIAGNGHVRKDLGVPLFLKRHQPGIRIVTVALIEVQDDLMDPTDYGEIFSAPLLPFDYGWFTPRIDDKDHCAQLRKRFAKPAKAKPKVPQPAAAEKPAEKPVEKPAPKPKQEPEEQPSEAKPQPKPQEKIKAAPRSWPVGKKVPAHETAKPDEEAKPDEAETELTDLEEHEVEERKPVKMKDAEPALGMPPVPRSKPPKPKP
ncbi:MAG: ChaN family lipoprotein [Alphaproteobacteria bacterium]|jgi:uncharacterized iron-regulated protein|nr:hypothetical protein [Rhodospirillaceae bacterium]MDP6022766.1 ChaN family lipoprotein [Alphaproteobacteria bacterium]MDP6255122.1 ChaN family lipoprotein [Alphaproteobacteria bacterium]MDP7055584.1 ChaN family lipoprotein [Alphaproteobacteria bacterium]MDP7229448.1 ChaN family lipoprotein [Alphaproteobacteria bacterium]|tara:strand:+ start:6976 stop:8361 length:1386 start_codon:yes stop_codon:yes gene_type:complete